MIGSVLGDAAHVYRRLWRRSVVVAGLVFVVISLADAFAVERTTAGTTLVSVVLALVGGLLVQGALVEVVRDLHEGREPESIHAYYERTRGRLGTLLGAIAGAVLLELLSAGEMRRALQAGGLAFKSFIFGMLTEIGFNLLIVAVFFGSLLLTR